MRYKVLDGKSCAFTRIEGEGENAKAIALTFQEGEEFDSSREEVDYAVKMRTIVELSGATRPKQEDK